jgi:macrolide transport system ATP-binding/permease protein
LQEAIVMGSLGQDIRYGIRILFKHPGFTAVAVLTLAIGIGANAAIFSALNSTLLRPLPVGEADRIVGVFRADSQHSNAGEMSYPDFVDVRDRSEVLSGIAGHKLAHVGLSDGGNTDLVWGELVTGNYFDVLQVRPVVGRAFSPEEDRTPGTHPVAVISYDLWNRRFGGDRAIAGRVVKINGRDFTVIGVAPQEFKGTKFALALDIWLPIMMHDAIRTSFADNYSVLTSRRNRWLETLGRLAPGVSLEQAQAGLARLAAEIEVDNPQSNKNTTFVAYPEQDTRFGEDSQSATKLAAGFLMLVVGVVLLIACANVSNLLLARASARHKEVGVRMALGAGRWRVIRQLLTEGFLLALLGGAAGLLLAVWASGLLSAFVPPIPYPIALEATFDGRVLAFSLVVTMVASVVFALAPALHVSRLDVVAVLKGGETAGKKGRSGHRLRDTLVVSQLALSFVLLVGAGLFLKSFANAQQADPGFDAQNVLFLTTDLGLVEYDETRGLALYRELEERLRALPGVRSVGAINLPPLGDSSNSSGPIVAEGRTIERPEDEFGSGVSVTTPEYFGALGVQLVKGRDFDASDNRDSRPVAVINEALAERLWPGEDPIGRRFRIGNGEDSALREVVGIARNGKYRNLSEAQRRHLYVPLAQEWNPEMTVLVRTYGDSLGVAASVRDEVRRLDQNLPIYDVKSLSSHLQLTLWGPRMGATLATVFGAIAMLLAIIGLYGVMSYSVTQQTRDIGIRVALGARPGDVVRMVVMRALLLVGIGIAIGFAVSIAAARAVEGLLFGVSPVDPLVFIGIPFLLASVAIAASVGPARRATRVDPMTALRYE